MEQIKSKVAKLLEMIKQLENPKSGFCITHNEAWILLGQAIKELDASIKSLE